MTNTRFVCFVLAVAALVRPTLAAGQGVTVGGLVAATSTASSREVSIAAATAYRLNRIFGLGLEVMSIPTLKPDVTPSGSTTVVARGGDALGVTSTVSSSTVSKADGKAVIVLNNLRIEIPTRSARVIPYGIGGGGVASVKERFSVAPSPLPSGIPVVIPAQSVTQASTDLVLTVGGGVSTLLAAHLTMDVDLRYLRLIGNRDLNVGRFGAGLSYRF